MPISRLNDLIGERLLVNSYTHIEGKFGGQYLCKTDNNTPFFSNYNSIYEFIKGRPKTDPFYISVLEERTFENRENKTITWVAVECSEIE